MREIVIPGEKIADGKETRAGFGAYKRGDDVIAAVHGLVDAEHGMVKVVPLHGRYVPREGDQVIGIVEAVIGKGCFINLNSPYSGYLPFFREVEHKVGELLTLEIMSVDEIKRVDLDFAKPLQDGKLIEVAPVKIPRIIGKKASMIDMLSSMTQCRIVVGRNGRIFLAGSDRGVYRAEQAIRLIEREAHTTGLTDRVKKLLEEGEKNGN